MKAIRKKPGKAPEACEVENSLKALQAEVGGYIESFQFTSDCTLLINEEGKNLGKCGKITSGLDETALLGIK